MPAGVWQQLPRIPPLHASRADTIVTGSSREPELCRICWEAADSDAHGRLIAPCVCRGSMRLVHERCLRYWQAQLRATKGIGPSRRCDVCRAAWAKENMPPAIARSWRELLAGLMRSVPWPAVLECWKFAMLLSGAMHGMRCGVAALRAGVHCALSRGGGARWGPDLVLAAGASPPLKLPLALCVGAFVAGLAAQAALVSMVCLYAGTVVGVVSGVAQSLQATAQLGSCVLHKGTILAGLLAAGALRLTAAAGRLAAPVLLRTLGVYRPLH